MRKKGFVRKNEIFEKELTMTDEQLAAVKGLSTQWRGTIDRAIAGGTDPDFVLKVLVRLTADMLLDYRGPVKASADLHKMAQLLGQLFDGDGSVN